MAAPHTQDVSASPCWKEYGVTGAPYGSDIDLTTVSGANGRACRQIIMLEAGTLAVKDRFGVTRSITTSMAPGTVLNIEAATILAAQTAKVLVIW